MTLFLNTLAINIPLSILGCYASSIQTVRIWRVKIAFSIRFHMRRRRSWWWQQQQQTMLTSLKCFKEHRMPNVLHTTFNVQCTSISYRTHKAYTIHCAPHICQLCMYVLYCTCIFFPPSSSAHFVCMCACVFSSFFFLCTFVPHSRSSFFLPLLHGICCSRCAVSRMSAAAITARCAVSKRVGQNHRKSFRLVSHFRLVCIVYVWTLCSLILSHSMYVYVPFWIIASWTGSFSLSLYFYILGVHIMCALHLDCIGLHCIV